ncbi:hypothetical protein GC194_09610 [bacterium]|nr:hypothetical protein [bacterium]
MKKGAVIKSLLLLLLLNSITAFGQHADSLWKNKRYFNYGSLSAQMGANHGFISQSSGITSLVPQNAWRYELGYTRHYQIRNRWSFTVNGNFGLLPCNYYMPGLGRYVYIFGMIYHIPFVGMQMGLERSLWFTKNHYSSFGASFGLNRFLPFQDLNAGDHVSFSNSKRSILYYTIEGKAVRKSPYINFYYARNYRIANNDMVTATFGIHANLTRIMSADFTCFPKDTSKLSTGTYVNNGFSPYISLSYCFTGISKEKKASDIAVRLKSNDQNLIKDHLKNDMKQSRRKAWFAYTDVGLSRTFFTYRLDDTHFLYKRSGASSPSVNVGVEKNWANNTFAFGSMAYFMCLTSQMNKINRFNSGAEISTFTQFNVGYGKWFNYHNKTLFGLAFTTGMAAQGAYGYGTTSMTDSLGNTVTMQDASVPTNIYTIGFKIQKNIRISERWYFNIKYWYNKALSHNFYSNHYNFIYFGDKGSGVQYSRGSTGQVLFGLKFLVRK